MAWGMPSIEKHRWGLYLTNSVDPISVRKYFGSDTVLKDKEGLKESIWGLTSQAHRRRMYPSRGRLASKVEKKSRHVYLLLEMRDLL